MGTLVRPIDPDEVDRLAGGQGGHRPPRQRALLLPRAHPLPPRRRHLAAHARRTWGCMPTPPTFLERFTALAPGRARAGGVARAAPGAGARLPHPGGRDHLSRVRHRHAGGPGARAGAPRRPARRGDHRHGEARQEDEVPVRHRRRGELARQGAGGGLHGRAAREPRARGPAPQARPLHQRRPGHHEPVPARRGVRHRRRRRDRPRPGPLRALHQRQDDPQEQLHHRSHLPVGHPARAARRVPGQDRAGDPPHHRRDQGGDPGGGRRGRHPHHRGGRHGGRHRVPALPRGHPPDEVRRGRGERGLRPRHPGPLHRAPPASSRPSPPSTRSRSCARSASSPTSSSAAPTARSPGR